MDCRIEIYLVVKRVLYRKDCSIEVLLKKVDDRYYIPETILEEKYNSAKSATILLKNITGFGLPVHLSKIYDEPVLVKEDTRYAPTKSTRYIMLVYSTFIPEGVEIDEYEWIKLDKVRELENLNSLQMEMILGA